IKPISPGLQISVQYAFSFQHGSKLRAIFQENCAFVCSMVPRQVADLSCLSRLDPRAEIREKTSPTNHVAGIRVGYRCADHRPGLAVSFDQCLGPARSRIECSSA